MVTLRKKKCTSQKFLLVFLYLKFHSFSYIFIMRFSFLKIGGSEVLYVVVPICVCVCMRERKGERREGWNCNVRTASASVSSSGESQLSKQWPEIVQTRVPLDWSSTTSRHVSSQTWTRPVFSHIKTSPILV